MNSSAAVTTNTTIASLDTASMDSESLAKVLPQLLSEERSIQTSFLLHLAAFDRVKGYERMGYATLWDYCRQELRLLEGATFRRVHAARLLDRYPQARQMLLDGRLYMTTLVQLEKILTDENADELFAAAAWKSKADVAYLVVCRLKPAAATAADEEPVRTVIRRVSSTVPESRVPSEPGLFAARPAVVSLPVAPVVQPVAENRFTIKLTVSKAFVDALEEARVILSHRVPGGEVEAVLRVALDDLIAKEAKRNAPKRETIPVEAEVADRGTPSPRHSPSGSGSRKAVPAAVRRAVWERDGGCCAWRKADGSACGSRWRLELDHILAFALGGETSIANLRLLCAAHNAQHAREIFGEEHMRTSAGGSRATRLRRTRGRP